MKKKYKQINAICINCTKFLEITCKINVHSCNILTGNFVAFWQVKNLANLKKPMQSSIIWILVVLNSLKKKSVDCEI